MIHFPSFDSLSRLSLKTKIVAETKKYHNSLMRGLSDIPTAYRGARAKIYRVLGPSGDQLELPEYDGR